MNNRDPIDFISHKLYVLSTLVQRSDKQGTKPKQLQSKQGSQHQAS